MSEPPSAAFRPSPAVSAPGVPAASLPRPPLRLVRLPVEKPQQAVTFLQARSRGVMDLIAHFWESLSRTPPLLRGDLHLVVAADGENTSLNINMSELDSATLSGAMLYVPKAHRADVLALDAQAAAAFAAYIRHQGPRVLRQEATAPTASGGGTTSGGAGAPPGGMADAGASQGPKNGGAAASNGEGGMKNSLHAAAPEAEPPFALIDLSVQVKGGGTAEATEVPAGTSPAPKDPVGGGGRVPIDFLTGEAEGIRWMTPLLLPLVHKRAPAKELVNVVMQLPADVPAAADLNVRLATDADIPMLNRWRRLYKEERGIVFDADMGSLIDHQRVFVYEVEKQVVAVAKIDLELQSLVEIGGVYTFPEFRKRGYGAGIVRDLAARIREQGKTPTLQVDEENDPALHLYEKAGWRRMGKLARVWLTG